MSNYSGYLRYIVPLWLLYMGLTQNYLEASNWVLGLLIALVVTALLRPQVTPIVWNKVPGAFWATMVYSAMLGRDLILSGIQVARIVMAREIKVSQGILALPTNSQNPVDVALSAHSITLTPGEMVLEIATDGTMLTHCLDLPKSKEAAAGEQEKRQRLLNIMHGRGGTS